MVEVAEIVARETLVQLRELWIRCRQRRRHIGGSEQQVGGRQIERHRAAKGGAVRRKIGRCRIRQPDGKRLDVATADPAAKADERDDDKLDALAGHRRTAAEQLESNPTSVLILRQAHGQRVAKDEHVADQALERGAQVGARHHGASDDIEARGSRDLVARLFDGKLPQAADLLGRQARPRRVQCRGVDRSSGEQGSDVEAFGRKHVDGASDPDGGRRLFAHPSPLPWRRLALFGQ
jgi:hypothetical protein